MRHKIACLYVRPDNYVCLFLSPRRGRLSPAFLYPSVPDEILDDMQKIAVIKFYKENDVESEEIISYYTAEPNVGIEYLDRSLIGETWYDLRNPKFIESILPSDLSEADKIILPMLVDTQQTPVKGWIQLCSKISNKVIDKEITQCAPEDLVFP